MSRPRPARRFPAGSAAGVSSAPLIAGLAGSWLLTLVAASGCRIGCRGHIAQGAAMGCRRSCLCGSVRPVAGAAARRRPFRPDRDPVPVRVVWATDIFAYFVGRAVGGPKLAPSISPGKTQSGALGGAVGGVVAGLLLAAAAGAGNLAWLGLVAFVLSIVAQAGDLFESWVKRRHGRKDSGALIPGHGGVMDRVDGLVAAAFALYVIGWISAAADHPAQGLFPA